MSDRPKITAMLSKSIQNHICPNGDTRIYWAREVTFDYSGAYPVRVDYMKFKPVNNTVSGIEKGDFYCYERFEIRKDDDDLQVGDAVVLKEWDGEKYTGREAGRNIVYILRDVPEYGLMPGYVIFGW